MSEPHLTGIALEALAAGDNTDFNAVAHLQSCARCRAALAAMRDENQLFAAELAPSISQEQNAMTTPGATTISKLSRQSHLPLVFYAAAASVMLVAALGMIYFTGQAPTPVPIKKTVAESAKTPLEKVGDDKTKSAEIPNAEESVFEGTTAANWEAQLEKELANGKDGQLSKLAAKCIHALSVLGRDALPQVIKLMRSPDVACNESAMTIIQNIQFEKDDLPRVAEFLKSDDYATRKAGVQILATLGQSPDLTAAVRDLLQSVLKDRDKAVVEVARQALDEIDTRTHAVEAEKANEAERVKLLTTARDALKGKLYDEALALTMKAQKLKPDAETEQLLVAIVESKKKEQLDADVHAKLIQDEKRRREEFAKLIETGRTALQSGDNESCLKAVEAARKLYANDPAVEDLFRSVKSKMSKIPAEQPRQTPTKKSVVGEQSIDD